MVNKSKRKGPSLQSSESDRAAKEKRKRTAPTNTSLLPPCKVCQEPAAGFHYGVNTCEACKGFFRRTLVRTGDYECINGDEKCEITQTGKSDKKRMCPRCRHLKCLAVGMSPNAIKTGRYTHAKRTQDILEYQQVFGVSLDGSSPAASPAPGIATTFANSSVSSGDVLSSSFTYSPAANTSSPVSGASIASVNSSPSSPQDSRLTQYTALSAAKVTTQGSAVSNSTGPLTPGSTSSLSAPKTFVGVGSPSLFSPQEVPSPASLQFFVDQALDHLVGEEARPSDEAALFSPKDSSTPAPAPLTPVSSPESSVSPAQRSGDCLSDEECRSLTMHLVQSHQTKLFLHRYDFAQEELLAKQQECYDNCKARIEAFGPMGQLSEDEYQDIYQTTGLDVDDRQAFVTLLSKMLDEHIRQYISFVKTIPGFSDLTSDDQIRLLKDTRCEVGAIAQSYGFNYELKVMTLPSGRSFCEHDLVKLGGKERAEKRFECLHAIQKLGLSNDEKILFRCMVLFTVGKDDVDEPEKVSAIQWRMAQCLLWLLKENKRPNPNIFFARIINVFLFIKEAATLSYEWLKSKPFRYYAQFNNNELLAEWFSRT